MKGNWKDPKLTGVDVQVLLQHIQRKFRWLEVLSVVCCRALFARLLSVEENGLKGNPKECCWNDMKPKESKQNEQNSEWKKKRKSKGNQMQSKKTLKRIKGTSREFKAQEGQEGWSEEKRSIAFFREAAGMKSRGEVLSVRVLSVGL